MIIQEITGHIHLPIGLWVKFIQAVADHDTCAVAIIRHNEADGVHLSVQLNGNDHCEHYTGAKLKRAVKAGTLWDRIEHQCRMVSM